MARRLITTFLSVAFALALTTAALASSGDEPAPPPNNEVPESQLADREIAATERAEASMQKLIDSLLQRLDRLERLAKASTAPHTETMRVIAVQEKPDDTTPDTTDVGSDVPGPTGAPTTNANTTTTTTTPPDGTATTTTVAPTTTTRPTPSCDGPIDTAIRAAINLLNKDVEGAVAQSEERRIALNAQANADEAALEAALRDARTIEDVNRAYADAATAVNVHYDGLVAAYTQLKSSIVVALTRARARMEEACADEDTIGNELAGTLAELETWDLVIESFGTSRADELALLEAEKAAFLEEFVPVGDDNGGGNGNGNGGQNGGDDGNGNGGGEEDGDGSLPFSGANALPLLIAGLILVGAGVATVVVTRRRRDGEPTNTN